MFRRGVLFAPEVVPPYWATPLSFVSASSGRGAASFFIHMCVVFLYMNMFRLGLTFSQLKELHGPDGNQCAVCEGQPTAAGEAA